MYNEAMLVTCPHCKDKIGEGQTECPMCKVSFSKVDIESMRHERSEAIRAQQKEEYELMQAFRKKRKVFLIALGIGLVATIVGLPVIFSLALTKSVWLGLLALLLLPIVIIVGLVTGAARCPHCGAILMRQYGEYCNRCGERIL